MSRGPAPLVTALAERRRLLGFSQHDVARMMGCTQPSISSWERGHRSPDAHIIEAYARVLGTTVEIGPAPADEAQIEQLIDGLDFTSSLNPDSRLATYARLRRRDWMRNRAARRLEHVPAAEVTKQKDPED